MVRRTHQLSTIGRNNRKTRTAPCVAKLPHEVRDPDGKQVKIVVGPKKADAVAPLREKASAVQTHTYQPITFRKYTEQWPATAR